MPIELEYKDKKINIGEGLENGGEVYVTAATLPELSEIGIDRLDFNIPRIEEGAWIQVCIWSNNPECYFYEYRKDGVVEIIPNEKLLEKKWVTFLGSDEWADLVTVGKPGKEQVIIRYTD